jgi:hypothetical protein
VALQPGGPAAQAVDPALAEALKNDKHEKIPNAATDALKKIQQK